MLGKEVREVKMGGETFASKGVFSRGVCKLTGQANETTYTAHYKFCGVKIVVLLVTRKTRKASLIGKLDGMEQALATNSA